MGIVHDPDADQPITSLDDLIAPFHTAEKPAAAWRLGAEAEKIGVDEQTGAVLPYEGDRSVLRFFDELCARHGWAPLREFADGPIIALERGQASVTLEPGAQLELSGSPLDDVHQVVAELDAHVAELTPLSRQLNLVWLGVGFHPLASQAELPWVPKQRYAIMREYLPTRGAGAWDMMRRTATVQCNLDYSSEEDAMRKLRVGLHLSPIFNAMFANSPWVEGARAGRKSQRGHTWLHMDPARSGWVRPVLEAARPGYRDYVEWALDAGMFLIKREGQVVANTGQTFRDFMASGFQGHRATRGDWKGHLATLFPEVRLKSTLELRMCDSLPHHLIGAMPALAAGLFYDEAALAGAEDLCRTLPLDQLEAARPALADRALAAEVGGRSVRPVAEAIVELALGGLRRRARAGAAGPDETPWLAPLVELVQAGRSPADARLEGLDARLPGFRRSLIQRCRV